MNTGHYTLLTDQSIGFLSGLSYARIAHAEARSLTAARMNSTAC